MFSLPTPQDRPGLNVRGKERWLLKHDDTPHRQQCLSPQSENRGRIHIIICYHRLCRDGRHTVLSNLASWRELHHAEARLLTAMDSQWEDPPLSANNKIKYGAGFIR